MKNKHYIHAVVAIFFTATIISCSKEKVTNDNEAPDIEITLPVGGEQYQLNDTIFMDADFEDESEIADITVSLIYGTDTIKIWPDGTVIFGNVQTYHLDAYKVNPVSVAGPTSAIIRFYVADKHENAATKDVVVELI